MFSKISRKTFFPLVCVLLATGLACPALAAPQNFFANPSFESGRDEWRLDKAGKTAARFTVEKGGAAAGEYSALITIESVDEWGTQFGQSFDAGQKGKTYTFAAVARATKDPVTVRLEIERRAKPWDRAAASEKSTLTKEAWTEVHVTFQVKQDFPEGWFAYLSCNQPNAQFRLDLVRLYEGEYVPYERAAKEEVQAAGVTLFDTGASSAEALSGEAVSGKAGWAPLKEDDLAHKFKGDAAFSNDRLTVVLRQKGRGAEVYGSGPKGPTLRAALAPMTDPGGVSAASPDARLEAVAITKNSPAGVAVEAGFKAAAGGKVRVSYELDAGQPFIGAHALQGAKALRVEAPCRFVVLPDFFADDIVFDASEVPVDTAELPSENFLVHLVGDGEAIVMTVSTGRDEDARVALSGQGARRVAGRSAICYGKDGKAWVAVLEAAGLWHQRDVTAEETGKISAMGWQAPWPAQWRIDWHRADQLTDSWEIIAQKANGEFEKPGLFRDPSTIPADRKRWTTVLGSFLYPCWTDRQGQGYLQPLKSNVVRFEGPALIYPVNRLKSTPLNVFTVADIMRGTLGVGPCEYILDVEGQGSAYKGRATCGTRDALRAIYSRKQQKEKRAEIEKVLGEVMVFIKHIRGRIDEYVACGHQTIEYLEQEKKAHPELGPFADDMEALARSIDGYVAKRKDEIKTPEYVQGLTDKFRRELLDNEGDDALAKCKEITEAIVRVGGSQDELVGECRMAVKILRQRAGLAMATDPRTSEAAKEIRRRAHEVLRNPAGHEGARH